MPVNNHALGKRIHALRKRRGITQYSLSEIIDKTPSYISYVETGVKGLSLDTFIDIVNALSTTADDLLRDSLENTAVITNSSFTELISDCSDYEQRVILETAIAIKKTLRENRLYSQRRFR